MDTTIKHIAFLVGAGASRDADILTSAEMLSALDSELNSNQTSDSLFDVFRFVKGAIVFAQCCQSNPINTSINIEDIMRRLHLLSNRQYDDLYPFIGSWHEKISIFESKDPQCFHNLIDFIEDRLMSWLDVEGKDLKVAYLTGFGSLASALGAKVRIFSLNYDLSIEKAFENNNKFTLCVGFDDENRWNRDSYEDPDSDIILYKLHGSLDWSKQGGHVIRTETIPDKPFLIFGIDNKLQSIDPYLYLTYQFREWSLRSQILISLGYSFSDPHINRILFQALQADESKRLLIIDKNCVNIQSKLSRVCFEEMEFELPDNKVIYFERGTKDLFENDLLLPKLRAILGEIENDMPF